MINIVVASTEIFVTSKMLEKKGKASKFSLRE